ncbi:hypothetical protein [Oceanithermus sp.]
MLVYLPDQSSLTGAVVNAAAGVVWLVIAFWSVRQLETKYAFLVTAAPIFIAAVALAIATADCIHDACPVFWYLAEIQLLGSPIIILGLAFGFTAPGRLLLAYLALSLPFALVSLLLRQFLALASYLLLLPFAYAAKQYLWHPASGWFSGSDKAFDSSRNNWVIGTGAALTAAIFVLRIYWFGQKWSYYLSVAVGSLSFLGPTILAIGVAMNILHEQTPWYNA